MAVITDIRTKDLVMRKKKDFREAMEAEVIQLKRKNTLLTRICFGLGALLILSPYITFLVLN